MLLSILLSPFFVVQVFGHSRTSITPPAITNLWIRRGLIKRPTFMSYVPIVCSESPCFFYRTFESSLHCVRYVLFHTLLLKACYLMGHYFGYRLFVLCNSNYLCPIAPDSMVLHGSYLRCFCNKKGRTGQKMVL